MKILSTGIQLRRCDFVVLSVLHLAFFVWYYKFSIDVLGFLVSSKDFSTCNFIFNLVLVLAVGLTGFFGDNLNAKHTIISWAILAIIGSILMFLVPSASVKLFLFYLLGGFFGISQLMFFTYFWGLTVVEERGRIGGLLGLISLLVFPLTSSMIKLLDFLGKLMVCIILSLGGLSVGLFGSDRTSIPRRDARRYGPEKRTVLLYMIPWAVFSLVNTTLQRNVSYSILQYFSPSLTIFFVFLQMVGACFGAVGGGVISDFYGRKVALVLGLTLYGLSSALSGVVRTFEGVFFVILVSGFNWGIFLVLYGLVIWGDLATLKNYAKMYSIGLAILYSSTGIGYVLTPTLLQMPLVTASLVSCLLIFLANIPVILAPELLPSDFRQKIDLKLYIDLIKRRKPSEFANHG